MSGNNFTNVIDQINVTFFNGSMNQIIIIIMFRLVRHPMVEMMGILVAFRRVKTMVIQKIYFKRIDENLVIIVFVKVKKKLSKTLSMAKMSSY